MGVEWRYHDTSMVRRAKTEQSKSGPGRIHGMIQGTTQYENAWSHECVESESNFVTV